MRLVQRSFTAAVLVATTVTLGAQGKSPSAPGIATSMEGTLEVLIEDSARSSKVLHFLDVDEGNGKKKKIKLQFTGEAPALMTGSKVKVHGNLKEDTLELSPNGGSVQTQQLAQPNTFGVQKVAVILVNFQDAATVPYGWAEASAVTFQSVNDFYRESTNGQTSLTGDVFGWFTIPMSAATCDYNKIATLGDQAAAASGVNLGQYGRKVYAFPQIGACAWWGLGSVGGSPSRAWINGSYQLKVVAHELGHNFGDYHSRSMPCEAGGCSIIEYGDDRDMMGATSTGHFTAFQKERLGWLNYSGMPPIQTVTGSGVYWIDGFSNPGAGVKALKILKSSSSSSKIHYYVEARNQFGFDGGTPPSVLVHTGDEFDGRSSYLIDLDPMSSNFDNTLDPGQSFIDEAVGLTITTISAGPAGAYVEITYPGAPCTTGSPTVSLTPNSKSTSPNTPVSFTMNVKNNDGATCAPAVFDASVEAPSEWSGWASVPAITVSPGATASATVTLTPPASASGTSSFNARATRASAGGGSAAGTVNVVSTAPLSVAVSVSGSGTFTVTATVKQGTTPVNGATVKFSITDPGGGVSVVTATTNASGVASTKIRMNKRDLRGTYTVVATATTATATGSGSGSFVY